MKEQEIKQYWKTRADEYGTSVHATTPASTAKQLEIDALWRRLKNMPVGTRVLEAGCGNGINCIELEKRLPMSIFHGFDYVWEMIDAAIKGAAEAGIEANIKDSPLQFGLGDVLHMDRYRWLDEQYDVVITDRCIINLDTWDKQKQAIAALAERVRPGGLLLMIENIIQGRKAQNRLRTILGLPERSLMPPFNLFMDELELCEYLGFLGFDPEGPPEDFSSLHDLCLYVLAPALLITDDALDPGIDYNHPLVKLAAGLSMASAATTPHIFGSFGQNRLFVCRKPA